MRFARMVKNDDGAWLAAELIELDTRELDALRLRALHPSAGWLLFEGIHAVECALMVKPSILEGRRAIKWAKRAWVIHNLIGHPLMQLLCLLGARSLGLWVHDATVPGILFWRAPKATTPIQARAGAVGEA